MTWEDPRRPRWFRNEWDTPASSVWQWI